MNAGGDPSAASCHRVRAAPSVLKPNLIERVKVIVAQAPVAVVQIDAGGLD